MTFIHAPLLQPLRIGAMTIQNRFCAGPLTLPSLQGPFLCSQSDASDGQHAFRLLRRPLFSQNCFAFRQARIFAVRHGRPRGVQRRGAFLRRIFS